MIVGAGAGGYHAAWVTMNPGVFLSPEERTLEGFAARWTEISDRTNDFVPKSGAEQSQALLAQMDKATAAS
jgi:thioredoxin reductase